MIEYTPPLTSVIAQFHDLGESLQGKALQTATIRSTIPLRNNIKSQINDRTGALGKSIGQRLVKQRERSALGIKEKEVACIVGSTRRVSAGFRKVNIDGSEYNVAKRKWYLDWKLHILDKGAKQHEIKAHKSRNKGRLFIGGRFVKKVNHPGIIARNIFEKALASSSSAMGAEFEKSLALSIKKFK